MQTVFNVIIIISSIVMVYCICGIIYYSIKLRKVNKILRMMEESWGIEKKDIINQSK